MQKLEQSNPLATWTAGLSGRLSNFAQNHGAKAFWGLMAAAHMPAMVECCRKLATIGVTGESVENVILLTLSMTFFLLKVIDVRFLRFRITRQTGVVLCVLIAFMHFDAIRSGDDPTLIPEYTALIATTIVASRSMEVRRDLSTAGPHEHPTNTLLPHDLRTTDTVWTDHVHPHCWIRAMQVFTLRAPPV